MWEFVFGIAKRQKKRKTRRRAVTANATTAAAQPRTSAVQERRTQKKKKKKNSLVLRRARSDFNRLDENTCSIRVVNSQPENSPILYNYSENQISIMSSCLERGRGGVHLSNDLSAVDRSPPMWRVPFGPLAVSKHILNKYHRVKRLRDYFTSYTIILEKSSRVAYNDGKSAAAREDRASETGGVMGVAAAVVAVRESCSMRGSSTTEIGWRAPPAFSRPACALYIRCTLARKLTEVTWQSSVHRALVTGLAERATRKSQSLSLYSTRYSVFPSKFWRGADYLCEICAKKFGNKHNWLRHVKTVHEDSKDFACDNCEKKFGHKSHLLLHQKTVHEGRKDYACEECEKKFGQNSHLLLHIRTIHEGRKDFACDNCEKKFGRNSHLLLHQKTVHEGLKDYICDECEKKFGHKSHLLSHIKTIHEGRKDFACNKCEKKFGHKSHLLLHQKAHLILHQRTVYKGQKDYVCDKCEKEFSRAAVPRMSQQRCRTGRLPCRCGTATRTKRSSASLLRGSRGRMLLIKLCKLATRHVASSHHSRRTIMLILCVHTDPTKICHICKQGFTEKDNKVRDHSHFTGEYRGAAHSKCNINYRDVRFVPVIFHNLSGYDSHLFIREVATGFPGRVWVLPQTKERYISFVKFMEDQRLSFRFIDSFKFMASSLDNLAKNLKQQPTLRKVFGQDYDSAQIDLLTKKGVFPYEYISSLEKLQETALPPPEQFYSSLTDSDIF
ncbi:unnamed protein product [Trichogramma brassicae]|uniref:C2H2-type domain-containing protein n=1 Tax=Trichogramma brassicae TaxID=86971 RepID=A0A6H5IXA7_9HYME|nr:unnamed protein product [Trichogramma brassicae]